MELLYTSASSSKSWKSGASRFPGPSKSFLGPVQLVAVALNIDNALDPHPLGIVYNVLESLRPWMAKPKVPYLVFFGLWIEAISE